MAACFSRFAPGCSFEILKFVLWQFARMFVLPFLVQTMHLFVVRFWMQQFALSRFGSTLFSCLSRICGAFGGLSRICGAFGGLSREKNEFAEHFAVCQGFAEHLPVCQWFAEHLATLCLAQVSDKFQWHNMFFLILTQSRKCLACATQPRQHLIVGASVVGAPPIVVRISHPVFRPHVHPVQSRHHGSKSRVLKANCRIQSELLEHTSLCS